MTGSLCEYMVHECLKTYTTMRAHVPATAASGLLAKVISPGIVLVRTGHVGTGCQVPRPKCLRPVPLHCHVAREDKSN